MSNPTTPTLDRPAWINVGTPHPDWFLVTVRASTHGCWKVCDRTESALMDGLSSHEEARFWAMQSGFLVLPKEKS